MKTPDVVNSSRACRVLFAVASLALLGPMAVHSTAANYSFDVAYSGSGVAALLAGSDNPVGTSLFDGDSFAWTIAAQGAGHWRVDVGGAFFPLMAFGAQPSGTRTGDFTLELFNDGSSVFNLSEVAAINSEVHVGTNTVNLPAGLEFDVMSLDYQLTTAVELASGAVDPNNLQPVSTDLQGLLPIFGAPEENSFSPGISYIVPEPSGLAVAVVLGTMAVFARRRNSR
ncbi:MAG: hypothetical protein KDA44_09300 [Planctomycetales bacterium]|nr:hypothetical protein [Planctomycetales bacterium]